MVDNKLSSTREADASVEPMFTERWSSKSFTSRPLTQAQIASLFEAARWAPSSGNRQPWLFVYTTDGADRKKFDSVLNENNRKWATRSGMIVLVFARTVTDDGGNIRTAQFDTGAAWMSLALQANRMGLNTRAMGGIDLDAAHEAAGVPRNKFKAICAIAIGSAGTNGDLEADIREQNLPNGRKPVREVVFRGSYSGAS
jgi:nitroreductase